MSEYCLAKIGVASTNDLLEGSPLEGCDRQQMRNIRRLIFAHAQKTNGRPFGTCKTRDLQPNVLSGKMVFTWPNFS